MATITAEEDDVAPFPSTAAPFPSTAAASGNASVSTNACARFGSA